MRYIKIQYTGGMECIAYQEVDDRGIVVRLIDETGAEMESMDGVCTESMVVDESEEVTAYVQSILKVPPSPKAVSVTCRCKPTHECV